MKPRRLPDGPRVIPSAFLSQVPEVIGARIEAQLKAIGSHNELEAEKKRSQMRDQLKVLHLPSRSSFESLVLEGKVQNPEVKIDEPTSRVYLVGAGAPDRQERALKERPVDDESEVIAKQLYTDLVDSKDNIVVAYTEISLGEFRSASDKVNELDMATQKGLSFFFKLPASHLTGLVLALANHSTDQLKSIARYALKQKGYA